jgi:hypothetical protein
VTGTTGAFDGSAAVSASTTIANSAVTAAKIANGNVTAAKLDGAQSGSAPIYGVRAWVQFDGTGAIGANATVYGSGNISSVYKSNTGDYYIYSLPLCQTLITRLLVPAKRMVGTPQT